MVQEQTPNRIKAWIAAIRPKTLTASTSPVLIASVLAYNDGFFQWLPAILCFLVALLAQISANFANDYFDFIKGADTPDRLGQPRAVASGWISPKNMLHATIIAIAVTFLCGLGVMYFGGWKLIFVGLLIVLCVLAYTGGPYPLAYHGLGDLCVVLFYGFVPLCFTYYVLTGWISPESLWLSFAIGLLSTNILIVNNYRDINQDAAAGKKTTIVLFGQKYGRIMYLLNSILAVALAWPVYYHHKMYWPLFLLFFMLETVTWKQLKYKQGKELNRTLEITAKNVLVYSVLLSILILL